MPLQILSTLLQRACSINRMALIHESRPIFLAVLIMGIWASRTWSHTLYDSAMDERHKIWMATYGRVYKDGVQKEKRFQIFKENVEFIESFNRAGNKTYQLGINKFADITNEEFRAIRNGYKMPSRPSSSGAKAFNFEYENASVIPSSLDWRSKGAVTPIKDQRLCGCCFAFSAVAAMEGITKISTGKLISLSEQEIVDCDSGGNIMDDAFDFIIRNKGLTTEANYPFKGLAGTCNTTKTAFHAASINGYKRVPANSEEALLKAVANQPVAVTIDASGHEFQFYKSGVFTGKCGTELDHCATAIGYGTSDDGVKYWLVKNSWGTSWGENGYIRMQRGIDAPEGLCGIAMQASYPTV